jgi:hypothetical protein
MSKNKNKPEGQTNITVGDISGMSGNLNVAGGNITTHSTNTVIHEAELRKAFDQVYETIDSRPEMNAAVKEDLKSEVQEIQTVVTEAVKKNEQVEEGFLSRRFRNIARMGPDVLDVIVATLGNPLAGVGVAIKKIADKAKEDTQ